MDTALKAWFEKVWVKGEVDAVDEYFSPDGHAEGMLTGLEVGPDDFKELVPAVRAHLRDVTISLERSISSGEWFWALVKLDAKSAETLEPVSIGGQVMARVGPDGKIVEAFNHFDFIGFFEQIGALPQDTMALCLAGERLS
ncbi:ester cyclase [Aliiroseovarius sp. PTFE2010]|uniref:ester cyclase n=1 Tax=Aliiroseovarius sp. PTFE2010 TaxID=3417190 RepID=UPI003CF3BE1E